MTGPSPLRGTFLDCATAVAALLDHPVLESAWSEQSVLPGLSNGSLAAHLARSVLLVQRYLDVPAAAVDPDAGLEPVIAVTAGRYFALADGIDDRSSPLSQAVAARGRADAEAGVTALRAGVRDARRHLARSLAVEPADRLVAPLGVTMLLDEYLRTRFVEVCVHVEDLALSLGVDPPALPAEASNAAVDVLVETAVHRHGVESVLRALTRRERDDRGALRVF